MKTALEMIMEERKRQVSAEGWTAAHDDAHRNEELKSAALCYEEAARVEFITGRPFDCYPSDWPWDLDWWKPHGGVVRLLVKAGALHQAEHDRCNRLSDLTLGTFSHHLPRICMMIDRVRALTAAPATESLRVLREIRDYHQKIMAGLMKEVRLSPNSVSADERISMRLHESFVEALDGTIRREMERKI